LGTTPPQAACNLICEETTLERTSILFFLISRTEAAVSSQEVSMPKISIKFNFGTAYGIRTHDFQDENLAS
jgi:hypothetical protein